MELRSPFRLQVRLRTRPRSIAAAAFASALLSGCFFFAQHTYTPWSSADEALRRDGAALLASARARASDDVVVNVSIDYLPRTRNRALREALLRYGVIAKVGPSRVDWTARARRLLAPCPYPDGTQPFIVGCRRVVVARLRTIALTSYTYDYTGFETGQAERSFGYRFTADPSNAVGIALAYHNGLVCSKWVDGESARSDIPWTPQATCAGSLARISHPTLGDAEFVDLAFDGLDVPSGVADFNPTTDRF